MNKVKELREKANISQEALGKRLGVTGRTVGRWENGERRMTLETAFAVCEALGVEINDLFTLPTDQIGRYNKNMDR